MMLPLAALDSQVGADNFYADEVITIPLRDTANLPAPTQQPQ